MTKAWSVSDLGDLRGKRALVTGANSGIGFYTALELGRAGAEVLVACRDPGRAAEALRALEAAAPGARFQLEALDLASLASVRALADRTVAGGRPLDILVNNAGIMALPTRQQSADGFELQLGTNHLGHFALTGLLLPALRGSPAPRVVTLSSTAAVMGSIALDDLQSERRYRPMRAYAASKLANLHFMLELGRRADWLTSVGAHPGATSSNLQKHAFGRITPIIGQHASQGALPSLRACVDAVASGTYFGPKDWFQMRGAPIAVSLPRSARDPAVGRALWDASEALTGVRFDLAPSRRAS
jgi:NAD(P)-dependent dehydrogenase (short-subunit alcohol dehydrogenase family)